MTRPWLFISDEYVSVQLVQVSDFSERGQILAYFETSAKDFIYPHPGYSPTYDTSRREVLMERSLEFPVSPQEWLSLAYIDISMAQCKAAASPVH